MFTVTQTGNAFGTYCYPAHVPTMKGTRIINNLVNWAMHPKNPVEFVQGELGPELSHNAPGAVDQDGYPTKDSAAMSARCWCSIGRCGLMKWRPCRTILRPNGERRTDAWI